MLSIPFIHGIFLRHVLIAARDGLREELDRFAEDLHEPIGQLLAEELAYGKLIAALDGAPLPLDAEVFRALLILAKAVDDQNEYARVAFEHIAFQGLLDQLEGARA